MEKKIKDILTSWSSEVDNGGKMAVTKASYDDVASEVKDLLIEGIEYLCEMGIIQKLDNYSYNQLVDEIVNKAELVNTKITTHDLQEIDISDECKKCGLMNSENCNTCVVLNKRIKTTRDSRV